MVPPAIKECELTATEESQLQKSWPLWPAYLYAEAEGGYRKFTFMSSLAGVAAAFVALKAKHPSIVGYVVRPVKVTKPTGVTVAV